jgi:hypothetical protein
MSDVESVSGCEALDVVRQHLGAWNYCAIEENWDQRDIAVKSSAYFNPYKIVWVIHATFAAFISQINPLPSDHRQ